MSGVQKLHEMAKIREKNLCMYVCMLWTMVSVSVWQCSLKIYNVCIIIRQGCIPIQFFFQEYCSNTKLCQPQQSLL